MVCGSSAGGGLRAASGPAPPARGTRGRRTGRGRLAPPPFGPPPCRPRPKHTSQSPEVVIFFRSPCRRHVGSRARPRDASGSVSRELPVLAGPGWQSGCAGWRIPGFRGPGTCNSFFPAGKLSGRGRGACPVRREPCLRAPPRPRRRLRRADWPSGRCAPSAPRRPPPAESCPAGRCPSAAPLSAVVPDSFCPVTLSLKHSCLVYFSVSCGCGVFLQSPKRKPSISACVRASLSYSLGH